MCTREMTALETGKANGLTAKVEVAVVFEIA